MVAGEEFEILVVGGGPSGALAATEAAQLGAQTLLIDKKARLDNSSACAGLLSVAAWEQLGVGSTSLLNQISGVRVVPPDGKSFAISDGEIRAYVVDRDELNSQLIRKARDAGVEVRNPVFWEGLQSERVSQVKDLRAGDRKRIRSEVIIGADGPHSKIREQLELPSPQKMLFSIQGLARSPSLNPKMVEVHFGREIAPDFFGWVVPLGSREARFGLASTSREGLKRRLRLLLKKKSVSELISLSAGPIPIGIPSRCSVAGNLLVGDAAAQVKPTTGGGIYPGSKCALIAGSLAAKQVKGENRRPLSSIYRNRWMDMVGSELEREMKLHKILAGLDDSALNILLHLCKNKEVKSLLRDHGDVDHLSRSAKAVLSNAPLLSTFLKRLPAQLGDFAGDYLSEVLR